MVKSVVRSPAKRYRETSEITVVARDAGFFLAGKEEGNLVDTILQGEASKRNGPLFLPRQLAKLLPSFPEHCPRRIVSSRDVIVLLSTQLLPGDSLVERTAAPVGHNIWPPPFIRFFLAARSRNDLPVRQPYKLDGTLLQTIRNRYRSGITISSRILGASNGPSGDRDPSKRVRFS